MYSIVFCLFCSQNYIQVLYRMTIVDKDGQIQKVKLTNKETDNSFFKKDQYAWDSSPPTHPRILLGRRPQEQEWDEHWETRRKESQEPSLHQK